MSRLRQAAFPVAVFVFTRVAILIVTGVSLRMDPRLHFEGPPLLDVPALGGLCRWDCLYYTNIALHGYRELFWTNFFPLFPVLGKGLALLTGLSLPLALVVMANVAGLGALVAVYRVFVEPGVQVVASAGGSYERLASGPLPANVLLFRRVPQVELLPRVDRVIGNGGNNSTNETQAAGRPLLRHPPGAGAAARGPRRARLGAQGALQLSLVLLGRRASKRWAQPRRGRPGQACASAGLDDSLFHNKKDAKIPSRSRCYRLRP